MSASNTPVKVLRNRGVPVERYLLEQDLSTGAWHRTDDGHTETVHVQFTMSTLADIEDVDLGWQPYERSEEDKAAALAALAEGKQPPPPKAALAYWQDDLQSRPFSAVAKSLALAWGWHTTRDGALVADTRRAALAMLDGRLDLYSGAVQAAYMIASGVDPERVGEYLAATGKAADSQRRAQDAQLVRQIVAATEAVEKAEQEQEQDDEADEDVTTAEDMQGSTPTSPSDLAAELAAKKPATARQTPRSGTRGTRGSRAGRGSDGTTTSSGG